MGYMEKRAAETDLLKQLLSRVSLAKIMNPGVIGPASAIGRTSLPHLTRDKLKGARVYRDGGGWVGDLVFKKLPVGVATVIGTSPAAAYRTREEAEEALVSLIGLLDMNEGVDPVTDTTVFILYGVEFHYKLDFVAEQCKGTKIPSQKHARERLAWLDATFGVLRKADVERLSDVDSARVRAIVLVALAAGLNRWPEA